MGNRTNRGDLGALRQEILTDPELERQFAYCPDQASAVRLAQTLMQQRGHQVTEAQIEKAFLSAARGGNVGRPWHPDGPANNVTDPAGYATSVMATGDLTSARIDDLEEIDDAELAEVGGGTLGSGSTHDSMAARTNAGTGEGFTVADQMHQIARRRRLLLKD